jgi:hypothetical protein
MTEREEYNDPGPMTPVPPSRLRRALRIAVLGLLIVSMVFLAWVSGRGEVEVTPVVPPTAAPTSGIAMR